MRWATALLLAALGCGDDTSGGGGTGGSGATGGDAPGGQSAGGQAFGGQSTGGQSTGGGGASAGGGGTGGGGGAPMACTASGSSNGDAIAISEDDQTLVVANRDAGTVTVFGVAYDTGSPVLSERAELPVGNEPWQVVIDPCGKKAFVVLRRDQKVVEIDAIDTTPVIGASVDVGSEPTGLALSPNGSTLYVANWVDGTLSVIDTQSLSATSLVDLNETLAASGFLGDAVATRPALAHPRAVAVSNDGDSDDGDETVVVTEFFAQRTEPEAQNQANADINWVGLLYLVDSGSEAVSTAQLGALADTGQPQNNVATGCFPNQLQGVSIRGDRAFVTSICASPKGPNGVHQFTHPVLSAVDIASATEVSAGPQSLSTAQIARYDAASLAADSPSRRLPLVANDIAFEPTSGDLYITANGTDAVFRAATDAGTGAISAVGMGTKDFIDLSPSSFATEDQGQNPIGLCAGHSHGFAFVTNDVSRNVTVIDLTPDAQAIVGESASDPRVVASTAQPSDPSDQAALRGKRAFNTGLDRFSENGQGWGACQVCHFEGLSDNVTWYFGRGPRQSTSLDGSFASGDPTDQRVFNWTAVFDEIADFEGVARTIDGGVGAIVSVENHPPLIADRVSLTDTVLSPPAGASGLNGSAKTLMEDQSALQTWADVELWVQRVRSPRAPKGLDPLKVAAGEALFNGAGGCAGCHSGAKWTISTRFYTPSGATNEALKTTAYDGPALVAAGFPAALLPADPGAQFMRSAVGGDQIQCVLRNVGTFGVSPAAINVQETRHDLTAAQGNGAGGKGFNTPSILGMQVGAPYYHAGNARTLEEALASTFDVHAHALSDAGFLGGMSADDDREALAQYLLSIDEGTTPITPPAQVGADGGDFCHFP